MQLTLKRKLIAVAGVSGVALTLGVTTNILIERRVEQQLATIQGHYLPRVELHPQLRGQFDRMSRSFQDAVAARDLDAVVATREHKRQFEAYVAAARTALNPSDAAALGRALDDYYGAAEAVSRRLIAEETGEDVVSALAEMKAKHARLAQSLDATTRFERADLKRAFTSAAHATSTGSQYQLALSLAFLSLVGGMLLIIHRDLLKAIAELTAGFQRFGAGQFERAIVVPQRDELGTLAEHANRMAHSLALARAQLLATHERLELKVAERTAELSAANEAIQRMNQHLERRVEERTAQLQVANRELESFSYSVAHDLRAPLRAVSGFAEVLLSDYEEKLDAEGRDCLDEILRNAARMSELIDALLSLSRLTRAELHKTRVDLSALVRDIARDIAADQPRGAVELVIAESIEAEIDLQMARVLFENLLGNAWKFTNRVAVPRIEFGVTSANGERAYFVRDNGAGFNPAYADKMFAPFQRLHTVSEFPGSGIGLATVQRIIQRHGGRIWAEGQIGAGATLYFTLPERAEREADEEEAAASRR